MSPRPLLRLEGGLAFCVSVFAYSLLDASWWLFLALLLGPDLFMVGYLGGARLGAVVYNLGHTYAGPALLGAAAVGLDSAFVGALALIWSAHIGMDRALGYGLKRASGFHDTHLTRLSSDSRQARLADLKQSTMTGVLLIGLAMGVTACQSGPPLEEGRWTGTLSPMNHPDMATAVAYDVRREDGQWALDLVGPTGPPLSTRHLRLDDDTLFFAFTEPEEQVPLDCALGRQEGRGFAGTCVDASGKWARFTMEPPSP